MLTGFSITLFAQEEKPITETHKNEVGVNISYLLSNIFGFSDAYFYDYYSYGYYYNPGGYLLTYKRYIRNSAFRFAAGGLLSNSNTEGDNVAFTCSYKNKSISLRAGYQWEYRISQKFNVFYGADLVFDNTRVENTFNYINAEPNYTINSKSVSFGGGPLLGYPGIWLSA